MLVFLVDDDTEDHEIFEIAFGKAFSGYTLVTADNAIDAIEKLKDDSTFNPDIIFVDINMPRMNGKDCVRELRKIQTLEKTPIVLYSTHDNHKEIVEAQQAGASDFMTKPGSIQQYTKVLQEMVNKYLNVD